MTTFPTAKPTPTPEEQADAIRKAEKARRKRAAAADDLRETQNFIDRVDEDFARFTEQRNAESDLRLADTLADLADDAQAKVRRYIERADVTADSSERAKFQTQARAAHQRAAQWRQMRDELRVTVREPDVYGPASEHSYLLDLARSVLPDHAVTGKPEALARLQRHAQDVERRIRSGTARAVGAAKTVNRETRSPGAMTTAEGSGGVFVSPAILTERWVDYRTWPATFANACTNGPLPDYGMTVQVPYVQGAITVTTASTSQNAAYTETEALATGYRPGGNEVLIPTGGVNTYVGGAFISQQLLDRAGPTGIDEVLYAQAREQLETVIDTATITKAITTSTKHITRAKGSTTAVAGIPQLYSDCMQAGASLETSAGNSLPPTHAFLQPTLAQWMQSQCDSEGRPIWLPNGTATPDIAGSGFSGYRVGSTAVFVDNNLPTVSSKFKWLVSSPALSVLVLRSEPVCQVVIGPTAEALDCLVRLYSYAAIVVLRPAGTATVTGAGYPSIVTWA